MKLDHLTIDQLKPCPLNVRKKGAKDIADLVPSIRALGVLQPLLVRANCEGYEVVAGQRRYNALTTLAAEGPVDPVPCIIMDEGDDAAAIEASLAENVARLPMDEIDQYKAFAALIDKGDTAAEVAARFGVSERLVTQRLAISRIIDPILNAYRREEIKPDTLRILTMATTRQQKDWYRLFKSEDEYAPVGRTLREWLLGGSQIPVGNALFDVAAYSGAIVSDLFGTERYFAKAEDFWTLQNTAIAKARESYIEKGWQDVVILDVGRHWQGWDYTKVPKTKGGYVYVTCTHDGEVEFHEGFRLTREIRRKDQQGGEGAAAPKAVRPELTKAMQNYLALHRQSAVSAALLGHSGVALRLVVLHMLAGSPLWRISAEPLRADNKAITQSVAASRGQTRHAEARAEIRQLLGIGGEDDEPVTGLRGDMAFNVCRDELFAAIMALDDEAVTQVLTFLMAESLSADDELIELTGQHIGIDMRQWWEPDETFFELLRDKEALNAMIRHVLGENGALLMAYDANQDEDSIMRCYMHPLQMAFGANVMHRIKRDLPVYGDFDPEAWRYEPVWHARTHQLCHTVVCERNQIFWLDNERFEIKAGERFILNNSYKYPVRSMQGWATKAGFTRQAHVMDHQDREALHLMAA